MITVLHQHPLDDTALERLSGLGAPTDDDAPRRHPHPLQLAEAGPAAFYEGAIGEAVVAHEQALKAAMAPWTMKGALPNFALGSTQERFARAFPADILVRLSGIARTYDPNGILRSGVGLR